MSIMLLIKRNDYRADDKIVPLVVCCITCSWKPFLCINFHDATYLSIYIHIMLNFYVLSLQLGLEPVTVGKAALGNMLGGIGYFFGQSKISLPSISTVRDPRSDSLLF